MTPNAARRFNTALDRWTQTNLAPLRVKDLEFEELVHLVMPWATAARELVGEVGLQNLGDEGERLSRLLNTTLDACEFWCESHGAGLGEILSCLEGVEDLLVGLAFAYHPTETVTR